jgi:hypothetical protein
VSNALLHRRQPEREPQRCSESRPSGDPIYLRASNLASVPALAKRAGTRSAWCLHTGGFQNEHPCQDRPYKYKYSTRAHSLATGPLRPLAKLGAGSLVPLARDPWSDPCDAYALLALCASSKLGRTAVATAGAYFSLASELFIHEVTLCLHTSVQAPL